MPAIVGSVMEPGWPWPPRMSDTTRLGWTLSERAGPLRYRNIALSYLEMAYASYKEVNISSPEM
jgi:hypothetical protein